ncbi:hypothetical protein C8K18_106283 [Paraburkholderia sp. GV068]|uniref:hypothetical protein n=1 Tax=Paraburkholderia TaxID=1822464 RepID=UPI000D30E9C5|nr:MULTISPECIES: hypothetical protein [unclassified Paraburkholderia]PTQ99142.1 hypothetical protein C8K19_106283 [Paraburkholderia sp. GV072]PUB04634.1 hypothetical protein C8K18_106283 [Paraburkholderia sp. GV068]
MMFGRFHAAPSRHLAFDERAERNGIDNRHVVRGGLRADNVRGFGLLGSVLSGWKACLSRDDQPDAPTSQGLAGSMEPLSANQQIAQLRRALDETRRELEVLVEALEYGRSIAAM